ncbi:MAG: acyl-CoA dehydrogenase family protein [Rhodothermia bacterium]|nr:MAG: acyl-CoA dehydrogenase family protein [Rhodothermia bacterium]
MSLDSLNLKNISAQDQKMILEIDKMIGPEPDEMGFAKNLFWGRFQDEAIFPYPVESEEERTRCDALLAELEAYLKNEHPSVEIDQDECIPEWCIKRLFEIGVMGMTVPEEYEGLGLGITSYNRALELIGRYCGSTAVMVSAHQSIGCKAIILFGTEKQKQYYLPKVAREYLSAFCLSEPNVGSDAAGQETRCVLSDDGKYFTLNGEKKWSTSASVSGVFTVMAKQLIRSEKTGQEKDAVTALICAPDMPGIEIFEKNRSKTGIRGTWQARIRFRDVRIPRENVLHEEGRGLQVALTCLNFGRCTLSAGVTGGAKQAMDQSLKWVQTRYQFDRPLAEFELVQQRIARMAAFTFAMDASLYLMTGMLDRGDIDIMVETAITKVLCSELGWEVIDDALEIMGGEGYMTENELERIWRDNRIHRIVEGSNEVMQPFIFAYGGKQLAEQMVGIQEALAWRSDSDLSANVRRLSKNLSNPKIFKRAIHLGAQLFAGYRTPGPKMPSAHPQLSEYTSRLASLISKHSHSFKLASKWHKDQIVTRQATQARLANSAIYLFAMSASLSRMDQLIRSGSDNLENERDRAAFEHAFDLLEMRIRSNLGELRKNADESMRKAAAAARRHNDSLPNEDFYIHEASPSAKGSGKAIKSAHIRQFPGDTMVHSSGDGHLKDVDLPADGKSIGRKRKSKKNLD